MRHLITIVGLVCPLLASAQVRASGAVPSGTGDSIRAVMWNGTRLEGRFVRQTSDSVTLRVGANGGGVDTSVAMKEVASLDARIRSHTALKGLGLGLLGGAAAGGAIAAASAHDCKGDMCGMAIIAVPITAMLGGVVGLIVGGIHTTESWEPIWQAGASRRPPAAF